MSDSGPSIRSLFGHKVTSANGRYQKGPRFSMEFYGPEMKACLRAFFRCITWRWTTVLSSPCTFS